MPMDRSLYPDDWEAIAFSVKEEANWTCQECGKPCLRPGEAALDLVKRLDANNETGWIFDLFDDDCLRPRVKRFMLTVAHLDHDPWNPEARLAALCAPCHCRYDLKAMPTKRRLKRERLGQLTLDLGGDRH